MDFLEIIELLKKRETDFIKIKVYSQLPGIYALFYIGNNFPLLGDTVKKHQIIYIGKTESSHERRDAKTHFTSGKTGSSTVRKSIGAILREYENLIPIPRNNTDYSKERNSHFKFDDPSEEIITNWMINNLATSFYEYPKTKIEIENLETILINELVPILNISKNPKNSFRNKLQQLRKNCATIAMQNSTNQLPEGKSKTTNNNQIKMASNSNSIFIDNITLEDTKSKKIRITVDNKYLFPSEQIGIPQTYDLNFKLKDLDVIAKYTIGSHDGRSRSGVLKIGKEAYNEILDIKAGTNLKITKNSDNTYSIDKLK